MSDKVRYPWAIGPPKGPLAARSGSTWIHWWSSVASAKRFTRAWSTRNQSDQPRCSPDRARNSSGLWTVVVMRVTLFSTEPDALVLAALGMQEQRQQHHGEEQTEDVPHPAQGQDVEVEQD